MEQDLAGDSHRGGTRLLADANDGENCLSQDFEQIQDACV